MLLSPRSMPPDDFCPRSRFLSTYWGRGTDMPGLEAVDLDGLLIEAEAFVLVGEEFLDLQALIALELDHLAHALGLCVTDDGAIASKVLLDNLEDLFVIKLAGDPLDSGQGLASITLLDAYMDILLSLFGLSGVVVGFGEGVVGLEIFD